MNTKAAKIPHNAIMRRFDLDFVFSFSDINVIYLINDLRSIGSEQILTAPFSIRNSRDL